MLVVTAVASVTGRRRCGPLDILVPMAGMTMQAGMGAGNLMASYNPEYDVNAAGTRFVVTRRVER